jgi:uncharacterized protein (DUF1697 family)
MPRYVALLRGVSPMNCSMPDLKRSLEAGGFADVKTLLSSGNVAFTVARTLPGAVLQKRVEKAMKDGLGRSFATVVRPSTQLQQLIESDPFAEFDLPAGGKRVVTFLRSPGAVGHVELPMARHDACILKRVGSEVFSVYVPNEKGPVFMQLLEGTFGKDITTRTWDTVAKCAVA